MNNLIIVESEGDKFFIEALIEHLNIHNTDVGLPICNINDYDCLGGYTSLEKRLKEIKFHKYNNIGIVLDADDVGSKERVEFINEALKSVCSDVTITETCKFYNSSEKDINVASYITNINGTGELEDILMAIKSKESIYADCLSSWRQCVEAKGKQVSDKEFNKFWVNNYLRLDTCTSSKHRGNKAKYCSQSAETIKKKGIWNFDSDKLDELKSFLNLYR